ncbi:contractile injection system protein, VgrG/Pvc8 family [Luteibacter sp. NPDC031894]|uniref:contractile injection system protein, VgrG/Pvc8 family n=1 Tax=Luteibacter sp. NPDC031894 TaxID=3390572 RepID=UPI003CFF7D67
MATAPTNNTVPASRIEVDGKDVTTILRPRLSQLSLKITRGGHADELSMAFDATDGRIALPRMGVSVAVMMGFAGTGVQLQGSFTIDEREHAGTPDVITVHGRSAKLASPINTRKERSFSNTTVDHLVKVIAGENGLTPRISPKLGAIVVQQIDQTESDIALLRRIGSMFDAVATVKNGYLVFAPIGQASTVTGKALPMLTIRRGSGDSHRFHEALRDSYTGVRARWHDVDAATTKSTLAGDHGHVKVLRGHFASPEDAQRAASAEMARVRRGAATFDISLATGHPDAVPEMPAKTYGWGDEIAAFDWIVADATHTWTGDGGYTTHVSLENKASASDHPAQDEGDEAEDDGEAAP